jgi:hypothetical protein
MSSSLVKESVPRFVKREGDWKAEGSNNALIVLGSDRAKNGPATIGDGFGHVRSEGGGKGAGAAFIVVGRKSSDPDMSSDSAFLYLSMRTGADKNLGLEGVESDSGAGAAAIMKSDSVRIVGRKDQKIVVEKTYVFISRDKIVLKADGVGSVTLTKDGFDVQAKNVNVKAERTVVDSGKVLLGTGAVEAPPAAVLTAETIVPILGVPYFSLQQGSSAVFAKGK